MVALTHKLKKAYDVCIKSTELKEKKREEIKEGNTNLSDDNLEELKKNWGFKVSEAYAKSPALANERYWADLISDLAQEGLLEAKECEAKLKHRAPILYRAVKSGSLELPKFEKVINGKSEKSHKGHKDIKNK